MKTTRALLACLTLSSLACSGGGGGGGPSTTVRFASDSSTSSEDAASASVLVELVLPSGALSADLEVRVEDTGTGSAQSGVDYTPFAGATLVFPAGSVDGATESVDLTALQDLLIEGDEEIVLSLASDAVAVEGSGLHTIELQDDDLPQVRFLQSTSATLEETDVSLSTTLELTYDGGLTLVTDVAVWFKTANSSDAREGLDLEFEQPLVFTAGSASGSTEDLVIDLIDDEVPEVDELAVVAIVKSSEIVLHGGATHQFLLIDDDVSPNAFLSTTTDVSGAWLPIENQDTLAFDATDVGDTSSTHLEVVNFGLEPLSLGNFVVAGTNEREFSLDLESYSLGGGGAGMPRTVDLPFPYLAMTTPEPYGQRLDPDLDLLDELTRQRSVRLHGLALGSRTDLSLELERVPSPLRSGTLLLVDGRPALELLSELRGEQSFWRGHVLGWPDSRVFLSLSKHGSRGWVQLEPTPWERYELASLRAPADADHFPGLYVLEPGQLADPSSEGRELCAEPLVPPGSVPPLQDGSNPGTNASFASARLALETDYQFFQLFGTVPRATAYATSLVAAVSDRFLTDAQVLLTIEYLAIYSSAGDPWDTPDIPGTTADMLTEFRNAWGPAFGGTWPVEADLAHFLSGADLGGGIAYVDALCLINYAFGVSANLAGNIDWDTFDGSTSGGTWDFVVMAHELGHNFGSRHTHDYCPPLDRCQSSCSGSAICSTGTIMSYCHLCSGGMTNIELVFHPWCANVMRSAIASSCYTPTVLDLNEELLFRLSFSPTASGPRSATLSVEHDGRNTDSPFELTLSGSGN